MLGGWVQSTGEFPDARVRRKLFAVAGSFLADGGCRASCALAFLKWSPVCFLRTGLDSPPDVRRGWPKGVFCRSPGFFFASCPGETLGAQDIECGLSRVVGGTGGTDGCILLAAIAEEGILCC